MRIALEFAGKGLRHDAFVAAAVALHLLRPDLDPVHSQMSLYLIGAHGRWLACNAYLDSCCATRFDAERALDKRRKRGRHGCVGVLPAAPVEMAIPASASDRAGESLTPSPIMMTVCHCARALRIKAALSSGRTSAWTSSTPTAFATD